MKFVLCSSLSLLVTIGITQMVKDTEPNGLVYGFSDTWEMGDEMRGMGCRDGVAISALPAGSNA